MWIAEVPVRAGSRSTFRVSERRGFYPRLDVDGAGERAVSHAGAVPLTKTIRATTPVVYWAWKVACGR